MNKELVLDLVEQKFFSRSRFLPFINLQSTYVCTIYNVLTCRKLQFFNKKF